MINKVGGYLADIAERAGLHPDEIESLMGALNLKLQQGEDPATVLTDLARDHALPLDAIRDLIDPKDNSTRFGRFIDGAKGLLKPS